MKLLKNTLFNYIFVLSFFCTTYLTSLTMIINLNHKVWLALQLGALFLFIVQNKTNRRRTKYRILDVLLIIMIVIIAVGYYMQHDYEFHAQIRFVMYFVFCIFAMKNRNWLSPFMKVLVLVGLFYSITTIWLALDHSTYLNYIVNLYPDTTSRLIEWYYQNCYAGITDHYSTNGMILADTVVTAASVWIVKREKRLAKRHLFFLLLIVVALFLTGKRAHLLFSFVAILVGVFVYNSAEKSHWLKYSLILVIVLLALYLAYAFIPQVNIVLSRFSGMEDDGNITGRFQFWEAALLAFDSHKWFGIGWFGFRNVIAPQVFYLGHAHNVYIQLLCETGIVGFTIFVGWFISSYIIALQNLSFISKHKKSVSETIKIFGLFSVSFQTFFILYCFTGNPLFDVYVYPIYFVASVIPMYYQVHKNEMLDTQ